MAGKININYEKKFTLFFKRMRQYISKQIAKFKAKKNKVNRTSKEKKEDTLEVNLNKAYTLLEFTKEDFPLLKDDVRKRFYEIKFRDENNMPEGLIEARDLILENITINPFVSDTFIVEDDRIVIGSSVLEVEADEAAKIDEEVESQATELWRDFLSNELQFKEEIENFEKENRKIDKENFKNKVKKVLNKLKDPYGSLYFWLYEPNPKTFADKKLRELPLWKAILRIVLSPVMFVLGLIDDFKKYILIFIIFLALVLVYDAKGSGGIHDITEPFFMWKMENDYFTLPTNERLKEDIATHYNIGSYKESSENKGDGNWIYYPDKFKNEEGITKKNFSIKRPFRLLAWVKIGEFWTNYTINDDFGLYLYNSYIRLKKDRKTDDWTTLKVIEKSVDVKKKYMSNTSWEGVYTFLNLEDTDMDIVIDIGEEVDGKYSAICTITSDNGKTGSYTLDGVIDYEKQEIDFKAVEWIEHPTFFVMKDISGKYDRATGNIIGKGIELKKVN